MKDIVVEKDEDLEQDRAAHGEFTVSFSEVYLYQYDPFLNHS